MECPCSHPSAVVEALLCQDDAPAILQKPPVHRAQWPALREQANKTRSLTLGFEFQVVVQRQNLPVRLAQAPVQREHAPRQREWLPDVTDDALLMADSVVTDGETAA